MKEKKKKNVLPGIILLSLAASICIFFMLLNMEKSMLKDFEKVTCLVARESIPEKVELTDENVALLFELRQVDQKAVPESSLGDSTRIVGLQSRISISAGSVVTEEMFTSYREEIETMNCPVLAGVKAQDLYQVVNGTLRPGNHIDIYVAEEETGEVYLFLEKVLVKEVFDVNGNRIAGEEELIPAARMNLVLEKGTVEQFYELLHGGMLCVVKRWEE